MLHAYHRKGLVDVQRALANISTNVYCTEFHPGWLRLDTAAAQLEGWMELGPEASYLGLHGCWKHDLAQRGKKIIWEVVHLAGVSESTNIPATQIREVGAGKEQMGMFFHYAHLETEVRDRKLRPTAPKSSILSYHFHPKCITGKGAGIWFQWQQGLLWNTASTPHLKEPPSQSELLCCSPT